MSDSSGPQLAARRRFGRGGLVRRLDRSAGRPRGVSLDDVHLTRPLPLRLATGPKRRDIAPPDRRWQSAAGQICFPQARLMPMDIFRHDALGQPEPGSAGRGSSTGTTDVTTCPPFAASRRDVVLAISVCVAGRPAIRTKPFLRPSHDATRPDDCCPRRAALPGSPWVRDVGQGNAGLMPCFAGRPAL
jgi:hypothetical protein